ncbi:hypothetical protein [Ramlibacter sp. PS4R-6]|uniref:hypothetical protein n=1 Tax=Ramlibacter sp. PS4R-6 TaxID=3133438 RepID=UPI0030990549
MLDRITALIDRLAAWSWPVKFAVGASVSAFAGGGVLAFLLQNAAYNFSLTFGFRPAVEGIPYLSALVTFSSVSLLVIAALVSLVVTVAGKYFLLNFIDWLEARTQRFQPQTWSPIPWLRGLRFWPAMAVLLPLNVLLVLTETAVLPRFAQLDATCAWPLLLCTHEEFRGPEWFAISFAVGFFILIMLWRPALVWLATLGLVAIYYAWIGANVLPADGYGRLLRMTGFGGGVKVTVEVIENENKPPRILESYLLLRSSTSVFLFDPTSKRIEEYQLGTVLRLAHTEGGLHELPYSLPRKANLMQR